MDSHLRKRVLVVDDSKFVRATFRSILSASFSVLEEEDGEAAWEVVSKDPSVVMVFTDLDMPRLDGFGLLARIRGSSDTRLRTMPVAIITGDEQATTRKRAREAGASSFISKSADASEVLNRIDRLLKMVRPTSAARSAPAPAPKAAPALPSLTGVLSTRALMGEGERQYASARRYGTELSVMALRIDSHAELARREGAEVAEQLFAQIARAVLGALRSSDALGRTSADTFVVLAPGMAASHMGAVARRLNEQLAAAQVGFRGRMLRIACSFGLASAAVDGGARSIEDLIALAVQRLKAAPRPAAPPALGEELERALRVLEQASRGRMGAERSGELLRRLLDIAKALKAAQQ